MNHREAFCVMQYRCENDCVEFLWNSRDGVTPFTMTMKKTLYPMNRETAIKYFIGEWTKPGSPTVLTVEEYVEEYERSLV